MSQNSDCPVNKSVILSFDAKEGQQSTFPLETNLDVLISSMLKGINDEYTKPISVVPAGEYRDVPSSFVKLNTPDVVIVQPGALPPPPVNRPSPSSIIPPPIAPNAPLGIRGAPGSPGSAIIDEKILPGVPTPDFTKINTADIIPVGPVPTGNAGETLAGLQNPAIFMPTPIAPAAELVTPNQPAANVTTALPPLVAPASAPAPAPTVKVEKFANGESSSSIERSYLISKIIGIFFLILIAYLVLVKLEVVRYY